MLYEIQQSAKSRQDGVLVLCNHPMTALITDVTTPD